MQSPNQGPESKEKAVKPQEMKLGEYFLHVFVEEVCSLDVGEEEAASVAVEVTAFGHTKITEKKEGITNDSKVYFGDHLFFVNTFMDRDQLEDSSLSLTVFKKGVFSSQAIGSLILNVSAIYFETNHTLSHRWFVLQNKSENFEKPMGFLKISVNLASDGDEKTELKPESIEGNLESSASGFELPPSIKLKFSQLKLTIIRGVNLPRVEGGAGIDAYLETSFTGMKVKTKTISNTNPAWYEEVYLPLADPSFVRTIRVKLLDYNVIMKDLPVGSLSLEISDIKKEKFKKQSWVHLYGAATKADSDVTREMVEFPGRGKSL